MNQHLSTPDAADRCSVARADDCVPSLTTAPTLAGLAGVVALLLTLAAAATRTPAALFGASVVLGAVLLRH